MTNRRQLLKQLAWVQAMLLSGCSSVIPKLSKNKVSCDGCIDHSKKDFGHLSANKPIQTIPNHNLNSELNNTLVEKSEYFERNFHDDIWLTETEKAIVVSIVKKLRKIQQFVGHGNFNILAWDSLLFFSHNYRHIPSFSKIEINYLEELFYFNAQDYGFMGNKVFKNLTTKLKRRDVHKVPRSGHYLLKGDSLKVYEQIRKDIGPKLILTSGVRGIVKQFHLFLEKVIETKGNLSMASRSIAPPGYSFHGRGDFDVGKINLGFKNFTEDFADTTEYKKLSRLGYVDIRYPASNQLGVRFEPWHVKVKKS